MVFKRLTVVMILLGVAGCGGQTQRNSIAAVPAPTTGSGFTRGTVVAVRQINSQDGSRVGYDDVLSALQQTALPGPVVAGEVVIRRRDGTPVSLPYSGQDLATGANVAVMEGATTSIHRD